MSDHPDEILRDADISQLQSEFAHLHPMLVEALFHHLAKTRGEQPGIKRARAYIKRVRSLDPATLWKRLRLPMPPPEDEPTSRTTAPRRRRPGRPGWSAELFWARYDEACERADPPHTYRAVARHFVTIDGTTGTSPEYLRKLVHRFGLPPG
jgi:hypothetical protein